MDLKRTITQQKQKGEEIFRQERKLVGSSSILAFQFLAHYFLQKLPKFSGRLDALNSRRKNKKMCPAFLPYLQNSFLQS